MMTRDVAEDLEETDDQDRVAEPISTDDEEDDEVALLEELIEVMVVPAEAAIEASEASPKDIAPRRSRDDEFVCASCHLILSRSCLLDAERSLCRDCSPSASPHRARARSRVRAHVSGAADAGASRSMVL
jgi:hypothetical protein